MLLRLLAYGATAWIAVFTAPAAPAQPYPTKPVRVVVPFAAGGGGDSAARLMVQDLSARLGQQVIVDNRGGAGGLIGMEIVKSAAPDGYTLLLSTAGFASMPALHKDLSFDPVKDFTGVIVAQSGMYILVVNPSTALKTVADLITYAKANPGKLDYASAGTGSTIHLAGELFRGMAQIQWVHVPYKGAGPAITDVVAGQVQTMFASAINALPMIRNNRLRALGVTSARRSTLAPDLPTIAESGVPGFEVTGWYGMAAPARTPNAIVRRLNADINQLLASAAFRERLKAQGMEPVGGTPDEASALIRNDVERWIRVMRGTGAARP